MKKNLSAPGKEIILTGLDGSNSLAFLAALGTFRILTLACPGSHFKMRWYPHMGAWRPAILSSTLDQAESLVSVMCEFLKKVEDNPALNMGDNLNLAPGEFREFALKFAHTACTSTETGKRIAVEFAAAFASDALINEQSVIQDTALRTMSGAGHQHFLASMRYISKNTGKEHLEKALFRTWQYDDPIAKQSLRWDPQEDSRYALQWRDPSGDPSRNERGTMLGANRLAIEGMPLLMCAPEGRQLRTVGFSGRGARDTFFTWPVWDTPLSLDTCRSLLASPLLINASLTTRLELKSMGIQQIFLCQRITTGKFRNFTPARAVL